MKISELTHDQCERIAEVNPEWMANNRPEWMADNYWMADNRPMLIDDNNDVPKDILDILSWTWK